jgi:hypothetical protein
MEAQRERAQKTWALVVLADPKTHPEVLEQVRSTLGVKRFELEQLEARLPGPVRYGARIDLAPLLTQLRELGVAAELRRRSATPEHQGD